MLSTHDKLPSEFCTNPFTSTTLSLFDLKQKKINVEQLFRKQEILFEVSENSRNELEIRLINEATKPCSYHETRSYSEILAAKYKTIALIDKHFPDNKELHYLAQTKFESNPAAFEKLIETYLRHQEIKKEQKPAFANFEKLKVMRQFYTTMLLLDEQDELQLALFKALDQFKNVLHTKIAELQALRKDKEYQHHSILQLLHLQHGCSEILDVIDYTNRMVRIVISAQDQTQKLKSIDHYIHSVRHLSLFQQPSWRKALKYAGYIVIAALSMVAGIALGMAVECGVMAALSAPVGGALGLFGAVHGAIMGGINGWSMGILAAAGIGLGTGAISAKLLSKDDCIETVAKSARGLAR